MQSAGASAAQPTIEGYRPLPDDLNVDRR